MLRWSLRAPWRLFPPTLAQVQSALLTHCRTTPGIPDKTAPYIELVSATPVADLDKLIGVCIRED